MKIYNFEYYDRPYALKLYGICILTFAVICLLFFLIKEYLNIIFFLFFLFGTTLTIYFSKRSKIKAYCKVMIYSDWLEFKLKSETMKIKIFDIDSYLIQYYNGTVLNLKMKNGTKFNIATVSNFNNVKDFDVFCNDFEKLLKLNTNLIIRRKSFFEKSWIIPILIVITLLLVSTLFYSLLNGMQLPIATTLITFGSLISLWAGYFNIKNKK